jgi:hypothetical protein
MSIFLRSKIDKHVSVFYSIAMDLEHRLRDYHVGEFTDEDVVYGTGLSARGLRELIKFRLVRTITEDIRGRSHIRLCDATVFKRAAMIAAINQAGFSLQVAGRIAYFAPFHTILYEICDPNRGREQGTSARAGLAVSPRLRRARAEWFDPRKPAQVRPSDDWWIKVYDRRFVGITYGRDDQPNIFGDLRDGCARFVAWLPCHNKTQFTQSRIAKLAIEWAPSGERLPDVVAELEKPTKSTKELRSLGYEYERLSADDPLRRAAEATVRNPLSTTTVNISFAIRRAIRCYLGIEQIEPTPKSGKLR